MDDSVRRSPQGFYCVGYIVADSRDFVQRQANAGVG